MEDKKPLISVCIPTYNREKYLPECLESIVNQEGFDNGDIEVVISDNASTDNTTNIVKKYQEKYKNIKYFRNDENIGGILNLLKVIKFANGKYCWFLSDDDLIENNNIFKNIFNYLEKYNPEQIILNYNCYDINLKNVEIKNTLNLDKNYIFNTGDEFLNYISKKNPNPEFMAFGSIRIFKKSIWEKETKTINLIKSNPKKFLFPHIMILFKDITNHKIIVDNIISIKKRGDNSEWGKNKIYGYHIINVLNFFLFKNTKNNNFKLFLLKRTLILPFIVFTIPFIIKITKKFNLYKIISPLWRKYILKRN